ncbi:uncharacterized protein LAESUDRAFT_143358 [Laetiporus sulphureus 93-53]|uniref:Uncharacterized protein n=1 Tax=Laetiporus sulphureus 93-53 TaxID=1314785 RepID=A0A165EF58_9APHY|nr:uncharacterized protein LAESUDRAFT_143358 [Laetiporus sulphureus 93-53]KZT06921.1 hypothetical protein LAESUDRAFT_143358 [Laetiporus sulphureus 93-53]
MQSSSNDKANAPQAPAKASAPLNQPMMPKQPWPPVLLGQPGTWDPNDARIRCIWYSKKKRPPPDPNAWPQNPNALPRAIGGRDVLWDGKPYVHQLPTSDDAESSSKDGGKAKS